MGQASAQREPSMEEILASIRRIIENNEPADAAPADQDHGYEEPSARAVPQDDSHKDVSEGQAATDDYSDNEDEPATYEAESSGPEHTTREHASQEHASDDHEPGGAAISLADVAARVRSAPDAVPANQAAEKILTHSAAQDRGATIPTPVNDDLAAKIDDAVAEELRQALVSDAPVETAPRETLATRYQSPSEVFAAASENEKAHADDLDDGVAPDQGGQLVSLHTGEKVAAAFGELSAAIAAGQTRSFDEIAEGMLKPMLTQWLDDNLPTLVERLVREEIERVSRGSRS